MKNFYYLLFLLLLPAFGNTAAQSQPLLPDTYHWYVSTAGNDNNAGTESAPFRTIQKAITSASTGQNIKVAPGTYQERVTISGKNVVLAGNPDDPASTVIDAAQQGTTVWITGTQVTASTLICGLTITGGLGASTYGGGMYIINGAKPTLSHLVFTGNRSADGAALSLVNGTASIRNSLIYGNTCGNTWGTIIRVHNLGNLEMSNTTVVDNTAAAYVFGMSISRTLTVRNSIIRNPAINREFNLKNSAQTVNIHYCNIDRETSKITVVGGASSKVMLTTSNITDADPLFVDASTGNYLLSSSSPCIDAGDPSSEWNDIFLPPSLGTVRNDLGAYGGRSFEPATQPAGNYRIRYVYDDSGNRTDRFRILIASAPQNAIRQMSATGAAWTETDFEEPEDEPADDLLREWKITVYPNPTRGNLQVDVTGNEIPQGSMMELYGVNGNMLLRFNTVSANNFLDISRYPAGIYFMRIILGKEASIWKIIKE